MDAAASLTSADDAMLQQVLEALSVPDRWGLRVGKAQEAVVYGNSGVRKGLRVMMD